MVKAKGEQSKSAADSAGSMVTLKFIHGLTQLNRLTP